VLEAHTIEHVQTLLDVAARTKFQVYQALDYSSQNNEFQVEVELFSFIIQQGLYDSNGFVVLTLR